MNIEKWEEIEEKTKERMNDPEFGFDENGNPKPLPKVNRGSWFCPCVTIEEAKELHKRCKKKGITKIYDIGAGDFRLSILFNRLGYEVVAFETLEDLILDFIAEHPDSDIDVRMEDYYEAFPRIVDEDSCYACFGGTNKNIIGKTKALCMWGYLNTLEQPLIEAIASIRTPVLTSIFGSITDLGTIIQALVIFGVIYLMYDKELGILGAASTITTSIIVASSKVIFQRELPLQYAVQGTPDFLINYSFPSGHTAVAFATGTMLYLDLDRPGKYVYLIVASIVGFSRVYLGVHYLTDVVVGALLGSTISYVLFKNKDTLT